MYFDGLHFQTERLLNPCTISIVEPTVVPVASKNVADENVENVAKNDETNDVDKVVDTDKMDVDVEVNADEQNVDKVSAESNENVSKEIVEAILNDIVNDVTRPSQETFFDLIVMDMVSS
jgi:hypothetical protein